MEAVGVLTERKTVSEFFEPVEIEWLLDDGLLTWWCGINDVAGEIQQHGIACVMNSVTVRARPVDCGKIALIFNCPGRE